jgi:hypothetical protein
MSELFGPCGRAVDGSFWCFDPPRAAMRYPALQGVLDYDVGGSFLSGFFNTAPTTFDCEIMSSHAVACEGSDLDAQLGFATSSAQTCPYNCTPLLQQQQVTCGYPCENAPRAVPGVGPATAIMANGGPCALLTSGGVSCWGGDANGSPVAPATISLPDKAVAIAGGVSSCAVLASGQLACWVLDAWGPIDRSSCPSSGCAVPVVAPGLNGLVSISSTFDHACVLRNDGAAFCWGENLAGELGDGTGTQRTTPVPVATSVQLSQISTGFGETCAVTKDGHVACWGLADIPPGVNGATTCPTSNSYFGCRLVPVVIPGIDEVKQVAAAFGNGSGGFAYALRRNGSVLSIDDDPDGGFDVVQVAP